MVFKGTYGIKRITQVALRKLLKQITFLCNTKLIFIFYFYKKISSALHANRISMPETDSFKDWFVLYTRPQYEKKISREISRLNYENYLPVRMTARQWSDRIKRIEEPLFPNYLFVRMTGTDKRQILSTEGAVRIVSFEGKPVAIKDSEILKIRKLETSGKMILAEGPGCKGDKVRVIRGILTGYEGELLRCNKSSRLLVRLSALNSGISVEISARDVEFIASPGPAIKTTKNDNHGTTWKRCRNKRS
jgi:transcription antitermination factor NusG